MTDDAEPLDYAGVGVDIDASAAATGALLDAVGDSVSTSYAGLLPVGGQYLGVTTDGVGTKTLVAQAVGEYSTIGIDCIAMNVNDLVAAGVTPVGFVDYLAVEEPDEALTEAIGAGLGVGAKRADIELLGGETAVMPEVITGFDLAGTAVGLAGDSDRFDGTADTGDRLVGLPSSGIHSNGLTLARAALTREYEYTDPFPPDPSKTVAETLLAPTRIYTDALPAFREHDVRAAAHITGGGWTNLTRLGDHRYTITGPPTPHPIFEEIQRCGAITDEEMYRTFNMGTGFVVAVPPAEAQPLADAVDGTVIGHVEPGAGVSVRGLELSA